jgi:hypothetical protein
MPLIWCFIAGAALQSALLVTAPLQEQVPDGPASGFIVSLNALSHLLLLAGMAGLARAGATGRGALAQAGPAITALALLVLAAAEFTNLADTEAANTLFTIATLGMLLGLLVTGVAVLRAGRWVGWHRFTPLVCALYIPLFLIPAIVMGGLLAHFSIALWGVCWLLLGLALKAEATRVA